MSIGNIAIPLYAKSPDGTFSEVGTIDAPLAALWQGDGTIKIAVAFDPEIGE